MQGSHGQCQALALAAAHGAGETPAHGREIVALHQLLDTLLRLPVSQAMDPGHEMHVFNNREVVIKGKLLGHVTDLAAQRLRLGRNP